MSALGGSHQLEWGDIGIEMGGGGGRRDRTGMWLQGGTMCVPTDERREKISMRVVHALKKKLRVSGWMELNWGDLLEWLQLAQGLFLGERIFLGPRPPG